ncbi:S8 family serine peptidase [Streptosporangium subroseum]|uniref:S8 family peptidase n=1 Tax=Streptosporangium subroseum TaxID=106412 RepID=UPI0034417A64
MRLRALVAMAIVFSIAPAVPAFAGSPPAPAPSAAPAPATTENPPAPAPPAGAEDPSAPPKLEAGLGVDTDGARVIVEVAAPAEAAPVAGEARLLPDAQVVLEPPDTSFIVVQGTGESLTRLAEDPRVRSIRRDRAYFPTSLASGLQTIGADRAHAAGITGKDQTIAIIDTGIDAGHPDLANKVVDQECFSVTDESEGAQSLCPNGQDSDSESADARTGACLDGGVNLCDHGTHVAGIAHAVAPDAGIVAIQVFSRINDCDEGGACLTAYESSLLLALERLEKLKETTAPNLVAVNLSLGGGLYEGACDTEPDLAAMKERVEALRAKGVAVVAAAGNEGSPGAGAPGCLSGAVTVGATDDGDHVPYWSNYGPVLDLFAPGVDIDSAVPGGGRQVYSGTSMSTPHVTGAMALMAQKSPGTPDALLDLLKAAGRPIVYDGVSTPRLDLGVAIVGGAPAPAVTQNPDPGDGSTPGDPDDDLASDPSPEPSSGPSPVSDPPAAPAPEPIPLPQVTVTVTVTATPAAAPVMCTRGTSKKTLTAAQWAVEITRGKGTLPDATLACYLGMTAKASKVFSELTRASTLGTAYRVLKPAKKTARAVFESELLAAWLNWAHGGVNFTAKVGKTTTFRDALTSAEKKRLKGTPPSTTTLLLRKQVNTRHAI